MAGIDFIHQNGVDYEIVPEIAPLFKTTVNYAVGDCVIYNAEAYRFKTAHLAGAWIGTDAEKFLVGEELGAIKEDFNQIANVETTFFPLENWRNGYIREFEPIGSVGNATQNIVCGYNGTNCTLKGDDKKYRIAIATGWILRKLGKYSGNTVGSFVEFVDTSSGEVTLSKNYYYIFEIHKEPITAISPSDVTDTTIVLSETKYTPLLSEEVHSYNWCNPSDITGNSGKYLNTEGTEGTAGQYSYTGFIPVSAGDKVYILRDGMIRTDARFRYVTAYNSSKVVQPSLGESTSGRLYTVPSGVAYIRVTVFLNDYNLGNYAININRIMPYDEYCEETLPTGVGANKNDILLLNEMPLSTMPEYIVKALAYRPLASLKKGYICLVTDDGKEGMTSYTIPMIINKQVPCTFAVMSESECFATAERTQTVVDAVNNYGCAISQHGGRNWTEYSEYGLNKFFEEETAFFTSIGLEAKSAVIPSHYTTPIVQTVAGGKYGVVRSGYKGYDAKGNYGGTVHNYYDYYTSGEGSNLFGLSSYNFGGLSLANNQMAIDYAYANNKIMIVYWHENALTDATKAVIEQSIDYAKSKGLEFITLDQIPYLNEWIATF